LTQINNINRFQFLNIIELEYKTRAQLMLRWLRNLTLVECSLLTGIPLLTYL